MTGFAGTDDPKYKEFCEASYPLMKWLADNVHPHHKVVVTAVSAELMDGCAAHKNFDLVKD